MTTIPGACPFISGHLDTSSSITTPQQRKHGQQPPATGYMHSNSYFTPDLSDNPEFVLNVEAPPDTTSAGISKDHQKTFKSPELLTPTRPSTKLITKPVVDYGEVPDLTEDVASISANPISFGTYSDVYFGNFQGQKVAIKALRCPIERSKATKKKSLRVFDIWWPLIHPNVLPFYGVVHGGICGEEFGDIGASVTLWCKRGNATQYLKKNPQLEGGERLKLLIGVTYGINFLHTQNPPIIHGDLKPANILIDDNGTPRICDFALNSLTRNLDTRIIHTGDHSETTRYLSYELLKAEGDQQPTEKSDVYALGCIGVEFLWKRPPYSHIDYQAQQMLIREEILNGAPPIKRPDVTENDLEVSPLWDLFEECCSIDARKRPAASSIARYLVRKRQDLVMALTSAKDTIIGNSTRTGLDALQ